LDRRRFWRVLAPVTNVLERPMPVTPDDNDDDDTFESAGQDIGDFVSERPFAALAIAALIGFVFARTIF
jgi:hypothetical protein